MHYHVIRVYTCPPEVTLPPLTVRYEGSAQRLVDTYHSMTNLNANYLPCNCAEGENKLRGRLSQ